MKRLLFLIVAVACLINIAVIADESQANEKELVKIAYVPVIHFAPIYVAAERGYFAEQGIETKFTRVRSGTECMAFLSEGKIDVGAIAVVASAWNALNKGMNLRVVASGGISREKDDPTKFLVRTDLYNSGEVTKPSDLKGRRVAMAGGPGGGGEYLVAKALEGGNLTVHDVNMVKMGNPDMTIGFKTKAIDAALVASPYADQILMAGTGKVLVQDMAPSSMRVGFLYSGKFIKERSEVAKKFMIALMKGSRAMQGKKYLSQKNMAAYLKYQKASEEAIRKGIPMLFDPNLTIYGESLKDVERVHMKNGRLSYSSPINLKNVIDTRFQKYAVQKLGKAKMVPPVTEATK